MGVLFAKDLILVDPDDGVEISAVLSFRYVLAAQQPAAAGCSAAGCSWHAKVHSQAMFASAAA